MKTKRILALVVCLAGLSATAWFAVSHLLRERMPLNPVPIVLDPFTRADGNLGNGWGGDVDSIFQIASNRADCIGGSFATLKAVSASGVLTDQRVVAKMSLGSGTGCILEARQQASGVNCYGVWPGAGQLSLAVFVNGTPSIVDSNAGLGLSGDVIVTLDCVGTTITATVATAADPGVILDTLQATDATYASGTAGLGGLGTSSFVDDFAVYEYVDSFDMTPSPTSVHTRSRAQSITLTCAGASWLSSAPDFEVSAGDIASVVVNSNTEAVIVYNAPLTGQNVTISDNTAPAEATLDVQSPVVPFEGNSLTSTDFAAYAQDIVDGVGVDVEDSNVATSGQTLADMLGQYDSQVASKYKANASHNVVVITMSATNDFIVERSLEDVQDDWIAYCAAAHADGFLVLCSTEIDRTHAETPVSWRPQIDLWNAWMRTTGQNYADGFADIALDPELGPAGASADTNYFNADKVHLNEAGAQRAADIVVPVLRRLLDLSASSSVIGGGFGGLIIGA